MTLTCFPDWLFQIYFIRNTWENYPTKMSSTLHAKNFNPLISLVGEKLLGTYFKMSISSIIRGWYIFKFTCYLYFCFYELPVHVLLIWFYYYYFHPLHLSLFFIVYWNREGNTTLWFIFCKIYESNFFYVPIAQVQWESKINI